MTHATTTPRRLSPSRLNDFLGCEHRTWLDILRDRGEIELVEVERFDAKRIMERGLRHEAAFLDELRAAGRDVLSLDPDAAKPAELAARTEAAMREGREVIHQACFLHGGWLGYADFLIRIDEPSDLGAWSYEVHDAKLARHPKPNYIFQLLFYTDQVERIQGLRPKRMHLVLGHGERPPFLPEEFEAYAEQVKQHFLARRAELEDGAEPAYPYPVADCDFCPWWKHCAERRRDDDHLSLVAMLQRRQGLRMEDEGVHTVADVATMPVDLRVPRVPLATLDSLRVQADLQLRSRGLDRPLHKLLAPEAGRGLARLPGPSPGDVFFDFEGDPYWGEDGLEYLFGTSYRDATGGWVYWPLWAESAAQERANFVEWMGWITARLAARPDMHIFHFNHYEPTAIKKLMSRYAVCEHEVDELLRRKVFVDLYAVVRQSMRIGTDRYGLKTIEPAFGFERTGEVEGAIGSLRAWQEYLDSGSRPLLDGIAVYNENDCRSTAALLQWLYERRGDAEIEFGVEIASLPAEEEKELTDGMREYLARLDAAREGLLAGVDEDPARRDEAQNARQLLADLLGYHRREAKPGWWEFFARLEKTPEQLRDEDSEAIGCLTPAVGLEPYPEDRSIVSPLTFPQQDFKLAVGKVVDPICGKTVEIVALSEDDRIVWVKRGRQVDWPLPSALIPGKPYDTSLQQDALFSLADRVIAHGVGACGELDASLDLLLGRAPRLRAGAPAVGDDAIPVLRDQAAALDDSALFIQGPPGSGKTYAGARLAVELMRRGKRVGVVATSHKAIANLLSEIDACADEERFDFRGLKKSSKKDPDSVYTNSRITSAPAASAFPPSASDYQLVAGTAWLWPREDMRRHVDVLFVDEAGQMSLADALAVAQGAGSVVLLGDPQQLAHVSQGTHPWGAGDSVLRHLLGDRATVAPGRGVLLRRTWRMHPEICEFVSDTMYDGLLDSVPGCELQVVESPGLHGSGLRMIGVEHEDNRSTSPEEACAIALDLDRLLDGGRWTDRHGVMRPLTLDDILVVAPYNAQVRCLKSKLPLDARVGTVDKFQGQEAPVVFFSMASSSGEDIPRGMDFLFSRNRLNVAVSRAQALAVVVCSPRLLWTRCGTVEQMRLVNMLCRFAESAGAVALR